MFAAANLPLVVMLTAVAVLSLRTGVFPVWLTWLSAAAAAASGILTVAVALESGPLAPGGWLNSALYSAFMLWLLPTTVVLVRRPAARAVPATRPESVSVEPSPVPVAAPPR